MSISQHSRKKGFTLIELLVVLGIFTILTLVVLYKSTGFNNIVVLENLAYDVALSIREAQVYGLSVREAPSGGFDHAYGIKFTNATPDKYILFIDLNDNQIYNANPTDEMIQVFTLKKGYLVDHFCGWNGAVSTCSPSIGGINISFLRPNPEAIIKNGGGTATYDTLEIFLSSPDGTQRKVVARTSGQISVE